MLIKLKICFAFVSDKASKKAVGNDNNTFEKSRQVEMKTVPDNVLSKVYDEKEDRKWKWVWQISVSVRLRI